MAISPLDLQTLFSQVDKVAKQESAAREGAALSQSILQSKLQQQTDERLRSVNQTQDMGEGAEAIKDKKGGQDGRQKKSEENAEEKAQHEEAVITDPNLGTNLDFNI